MIVQLENKKIIVNKLPLGKYGELLKALKRLPKQFEGMENIKKGEWIEKLPFMIGDCLPDFEQIISIGTGLTAEEVSNLGIDEAVDCVMAIAEVNRFDRVWEKVKKAIARFQTKEVEPKQIGS